MIPMVVVDGLRFTAERSAEVERPVACPSVQTMAGCSTSDTRQTIPMILRSPPIR